MHMTDTTTENTTDTATHPQSAAQSSETAAPITFERHPDSYVHWNLKVESEVARLSMRLRAQVEQLRHRRRYRTRRCYSSLAVRASGGQGRRPRQCSGRCLLCRCKHPDARRCHAQPQGQLLQIYERDSPRNRRSFSRIWTALPRRDQRCLFWRWLRGRNGLRPPAACRRSIERGVAPGSSVAGRPAGYWRPDAIDR